MSAPAYVELDTLRPGDPVWYRRELGDWRGYCLVVDEPAVVVRRTLKRVTLRVYLTSGATAIRVVRARNVRPRPPHDCGRPDCRECTAARERAR